MNIVKRQISELNAAEYNPRKPLKAGDKEYEKIKRSIEQFGYVQPIIINADNTIIAGHQRTTVMRDMGTLEIDCVVVNLDKVQEKALNVALNKVSGIWDEEALYDLLSDIRMDDFEMMELTGFDHIEFEKLDLKFGDGEEEEDDEPKEDKSKGKAVIQYNIVFDDEAQQAKWVKFIRYLKNRYPNADTIAERLDYFLDGIVE